MCCIPADVLVLYYSHYETLFICLILSTTTELYLYINTHYVNLRCVWCWKESSVWCHCASWPLSFHIFPIRGSVSKQTPCLQRFIMKVNLRPFSWVGAGKLLFVPNMCHKSTHTHAHTLSTDCMQPKSRHLKCAHKYPCKHADIHTPSVTKPAKHSCGLAWCENDHPGRRGRFPASLMGTTFDLSVSVSSSCCPQREEFNILNPNQF